MVAPGVSPPPRITAGFSHVWSRVRTLVAPAGRFICLPHAGTSSPIQTRTAHIAARVVSLAILILLVVALQMGVGAYTAERGNYPDEAAHFMNGLLVRDYLSSGGGHDPLTFAEQYYVDYPKVAPLIWPPLFHVGLGFLLLLPWAPDRVALVLIAAATAWIAYRLFFITSRVSSRLVAVVVSGIFLTTASVLDATSAVMVDIVVAAFALEAAYWFARYMRSQRRRDAIMFGLLAAGCCLTKANGIAIVLLPAISALMLRRLDLLRRRDLWIAGGIIGALAAPTIGLSWLLDINSGGDYGLITTLDILNRASFYSAHLWRQLGGTVILLSLIGATVCVTRRFASDDDRRYLITSCAALALAGLAFHILNPVEAIESRYIALTIAPVLAMVPVGAAALAARLPVGSWTRVASVVLIVIGALHFLAVKPAAAQRHPLGYRQLIQNLEKQTTLSGRRILVVSDEEGEGAMVAETAMRYPAVDRATIIRGTKLLGRDDWDGDNFSPRFATSVSLLEELDHLGVDYVIVDDSAAPRYRDPVMTMIAASAGKFQLVYVSPKSGRHVAAYSFAPLRAPRKPVEIYASPLHRTVEGR